MTSKVYRLIGAMCSRYSARVRSYLIKKRVPYIERTPDAWTFSVTIKRRFGDAAIPVLITPEGEWIADSTIILDRLEQRFPDDPIVPEDPVHALFTVLADIWASEFWLPVDLHTRWSRPENYPLWREELGGGFLPGFPKVLKNLASNRIARAIQAHLPRMGIEPNSTPLVERWATRTMDVLDAHFSRYPYLLGERASCADYGLICPFFGHLVRDVTSLNGLILPRPHLHAWIWRMNQPYLTARAPAFPAAGTPLPDTLQPVVRSMFVELLPYIQGTLAEMCRAVSTGSRGERVPRFLGMVRFSYADDEFQRLAMPFTLWLTQRVLDRLRAMEPEDAKRARVWLKDNGGAALLELDIPRLEVSGLTVKFAWSQPAAVRQPRTVARPPSASPSAD